MLFHCEPVSSYFNKTDPAKNHEIHSFDEIAAGVEKLRARGLDRAYFHIDGWGKMGYDNLHPDVTPPCPEAGRRGGDAPDAGHDAPLRVSFRPARPVPRLLSQGGEL